MRERERKIPVTASRGSPSTGPIPTSDPSARRGAETSAVHRAAAPRQRLLPSITNSTREQGDRSSSLRSSCSFNILDVDLWGLFASLCRIDDEFERVRVLILFHQLQIGQPLGAFQSFAAGKLLLCGFDQL